MSQSSLHVSAIVVAQQPGDKIDACLSALNRSCHPHLECVVVGPTKLQETLDRPDMPSIKFVPYQGGNLAAARNRGLAEAAGDIVAFVSPEMRVLPTWCEVVLPPFQDPDIAAATARIAPFLDHGPAASVDRTGKRTRLALAADTAHVLGAAADRGVATDPRLSVFRRDALAAFGGFRTAYTDAGALRDLNLRMGQAGHRTAILPGYLGVAKATDPVSPVKAAVHEAQARLQLARTHLSEDRHDWALRRIRTDLRLGLLRAMQTGDLDAWQVWKALNTPSLRSLPSPKPAVSAQIPRARTGFRSLRDTGTKAPQVHHVRVPALQLAQVIRRTRDLANDRESVVLHARTLFGRRSQLVQVNDGVWLSRTDGVSGVQSKAMREIIRSHSG